MRQIREVLRYRCECHLSLDRVAAALGISKGSVHSIIGRFSKSGLAWPLEATLTDSMLEERLYGPEPEKNPAKETFFDIEYIRKELARPHVTIELLWREYNEAHHNVMSRSTFYRYCQEAQPSPEPDMKMIHKGGDKLFVDYSGDGLYYIERATGEIFDVEFFVACWGASSFTYAGARLTQKTPEFCLSHVDAFEYSGCVPHALVPDNLKSGVKKACRYEPEMNPLYAKLAEHYGIAILPARVREPQDKAPVESAVGFAQRYILGRLRNRQFFSLHEINEAIRGELDNLNNEPMQGYGGKSRRERFEELDKPYALPLPSKRFIITDVKYNVGVAPNYHLRYEDHFYSVPSHLARNKVDVYLTGSTIEIYHDGVHICRHLKQPGNFGYTTNDEHMPPNHRYVKGWSPEWFIDRASKIGIATAEVAQLVMKRNRHPQQGFNSVMGILNFVKQYTAPRVEAACRRAIRFHSVSYRNIKSILEKNLDKETAPVVPTSIPIVAHENVRGPDYFTNTQQVQE